MAEMAMELRQGGLPLSNDILNVGDMLKELKQCLSKSSI